MQKKKIICILGKSCAGKDTAVISLQNLIIKEKVDNLPFLPKNALNAFKKAISYTTRPKRINEIDGLEYHFVDNEEFENIRNTVGFVEETFYEVNGEIWHYGFSNDEFEEDATYIVVANPRGLEAFLHSEFKDVIEPIYLECDEEIRKERYSQRDNGNPLLEKQWQARKKQDDEDFKDIFDLLLNFKSFTVINTKLLSKEEVAKNIIGLL